jgi:heme-degrading monooxygenase HmoA
LESATSTGFDIFLARQGLPPSFLIPHLALLLPDQILYVRPIGREETIVTTNRIETKGGKMVIKVIIKRIVPRDRVDDLIPLFQQLRTLATNQPGYITGETLRRLDKPEEFLVISTWESLDHWKKWVVSQERNEVQGRIDALLGARTEYEIYHYSIS